MKEMSKKVAKDLYCRMLGIRLFEEKIVKVYRKVDMRTPVHLYLGQEAVAAGVCATLRKDDYVFGTHRSHGVYIAKGGNLKKLTAELFGKRTGCSRGKGGSMHVVDTKQGVCGTTAIVGGNIPLAVGAALASVLKNSTQIACAFFGDGAVDEGVFYESMNFAALKRLPVLFICENNFYATHSHVSKRQPFDNICARGVCFGMPEVRVDGNDVRAVYSAAYGAVQRARKGGGPTLIECRTYRWKSHVGPESDQELGTPPKKHLSFWLKRCPLKVFKAFLQDKGWWKQMKISEIEKKIQREIAQAFIFAEKSVFPAPKELFEDVLT